jgi:hypothetical protein
VLAVLSAVAAVVISCRLFPQLSINNDEGIYLLHARTLAGGHLFPPAPQPADSFLPWLAVADGDHYVLKYTPFVPAILAASLAVTGGVSAALALVAGSAVVLAYLLGKELFADRRVAATAATLFAASPLVVVQSGLLLGYLPVLVGVQAGTLLLIRGVRGVRGEPGERIPRGVRGVRPGALAGAGFALGCAAAVRPFDVVLLVAPVCGWAFAACRGRRWRALRSVAAGLAVPAALLLASNTAATGSPTTLPFTLLEPSDTLGFGVRRLYPSDGVRHFGPREGLAGVGSHLSLLGGWAFAGVLLAVCAALALVRRRVPAPGLALGAGAASLLVGYIGFWGVWNAAELWGGIRYLGPFYVLPVLVPLVLFGARGLVDLVLASRPGRRRPPAGLARLAGLARPVRSAVAVLTVLGLLAAGASSTAVLVEAVRANAGFTRHDADLARLVDAQPGRGLVFVGIDPPYLGHPVNALSNPPGLDGRALFAVSRGADDLTVAAGHPDRRLYLLRTPSAFNGAPETRSTGTLERLEREEATGRPVEVSLTIDAAPAGFRAARVVVTAHGRRSSYPVDPRRGARATLTVTGDGLSVTGLGTPSAVTGLAPAFDASVVVAFHATPERGGERFVDRVVLPVAASRAAPSPSSSSSGSSSGAVAVLVPSGVVGAVGEGRQPCLHLARATAPTA